MQPPLLQSMCTGCASGASLASFPDHSHVQLVVWIVGWCKEWNLSIVYATIAPKVGVEAPPPCSLSSWKVGYVQINCTTAPWSRMKHPTLSPSSNLSDPFLFYSLGTWLPFHILCSVSVLIDSLPSSHLYIPTAHVLGNCSPLLIFHGVANEVGNSCTLSLPPELVESPPSGDIPSSRQWELVCVADSSQLGSAERTRELRQRKTEHGIYGHCY